MFRGLQSRIIIAFGLVILLAVALSGGLALRTTTNEFELFVTEEGVAQAADIAVFLEAGYNHRGQFGDLEELLQQSYGFAEFPTELLIEETAIMEDENGELIYLEEDALAPYPVWDKIIAQELGVSFVEYQELRQELAIADIAFEQDVPVEQLTAAVMRFEREQLPTAAEFLFAEDEVYYLSDMLYWVQDYIYASPFAADELGDAGYFYDTLFADVRFLLADEAGSVIFDSQESELVAEQLTDMQLEQGVDIHDWATGDVVATVIVAAGEGFYRSREEAFLSNVMQALVIGGLLATVSALVVGWVLARQISAPVTALTQAATHLAQGNHSERLPVQSNDELGKMSTAFNTLADALDTQQMLRRRLVADVSHELNTPLSVIQLEMEALRDGIQPADDAATQVLQEIDLLRSLTQDLTLLADRDQGTLTLVREPVEMSVLVPQAVDRWRSKAEAAGVELAIRPFPSLPTIQADAMRLNQVLANLIRNALQHTSAGDRIEIRCTTGSIPGQSGTWMITSVQDTGEGMAAAHLPFVFERFYRADRARRRESGGRGLGLAIVRDIIDLHGGYVWVESVPGEGSTFSFALQ